jgi:hypothetical protein
MFEHLAEIEQYDNEQYYRGRRKKKYQKRKRNSKLKNSNKNKRQESTQDDNTFEELSKSKTDIDNNTYLKSILKPPTTMLLIKDKPKDEDESKSFCVIC